MHQYSDAKTCGLCGITSPRRYVRKTIVHAKWMFICVDERECEKNRQLKLPLPPPIDASEKSGVLVPPEHIEIDKRAREEKERMRLAELRERAKRRREEVLGERALARLFEAEFRATQKPAKA